MIAAHLYVYTVSKLSYLWKFSSARALIIILAVISCKKNTNLTEEAADLCIIWVTEKEVVYIGALITLPSPINFHLPRFIFTLPRFIFTSDSYLSSLFYMYTFPVLYVPSPIYNFTFPPSEIFFPGWRAILVSWLANSGRNFFPVLTDEESGTD